MMLSYRTDHPNHLHQFVMAVSKHYYAGKDGVLKYQKKDMDVSLSKISSSERQHMIIYSLRDHCSGVFYSEISFAPNIIPPQEFLYRAWSPKNDYLFQGTPPLLTLPRTVRDAFPELASQVSALGIKLIDVTSGFQSGVRDLRTIESRFAVMANSSVAQAKEWMAYICRSRAEDKSRSRDKSKIELWADGVPTIRQPPLDWCNGA